MDDLIADIKVACMEFEALESRIEDIMKPYVCIYCWLYSLSFCDSNYGIEVYWPYSILIIAKNGLLFLAEIWCQIYCVNHGVA